MKKEMLINVLQPEECRIAIVEDEVLEELYVERTSHESYVGNIYKGRIVNLEPSIQAAFVDFGVGRNGFLHVSDVEPQYYRHKLEEDQPRKSHEHQWQDPAGGDDKSKPRRRRDGKGKDTRGGGQAPRYMPSAHRKGEEQAVADLDDDHAELESGPSIARAPNDIEFDDRDGQGRDLEILDAQAEIEDAVKPSPRGQRKMRGRRPGGRPGNMPRPKPPIQEIFRRGQEVLVQVIKEGIGTKGPTLSTYISIPGRYLVLMPGLNRIGVSRKIVDEQQRRRLRDVLGELEPPKGLGFIIRTAGIDRNKKELQRDLAYLSRLWKVVVCRIKDSKAPAPIYQESDMIIRTIRDIFTSEIDTIWVDESTAYDHAQEFLQFVMPRYSSRIKLYSGSEPLFHRYGIEEEISRIQRRHVPLPMGGSIVIDPTEALVAIDVNSGNFRADNNAEETAYRMNLQAAKAIARQLRLRDLGGVIVNDFIDMREERHRRGVEKALRDAIKRDRARTKVLRMSAFGLIEMTRQRIRPSLKRSVFEDCSHCRGTGQVKTGESMSIDVMRMLQLAAHKEGISRVQVGVAEGVAQYLLNRKRGEIAQLEESGDMQVVVRISPDAAPEDLEITCFDSAGGEVKLGFESGAAQNGRGKARK